MAHGEISRPVQGRVPVRAHSAARRLFVAVRDGEMLRWEVMGCVGQVPPSDHCVPAFLATAPGPPLRSCSFDQSGQSVPRITQRHQKCLGPHLYRGMTYTTAISLPSGYFSVPDIYEKNLHRHKETCLSSIMSGRQSSSTQASRLLFLFMPTIHRAGPHTFQPILFMRRIQIMLILRWTTLLPANS